MEKKQPTFLELLLEAHIDLKRQGPGSDAATLRALELIGPLDGLQRAADLGCGTGTQTLLLARHLPGQIVGLDMFDAVVDRLNARAAAAGLSDRVRGIFGRMENLPFEARSLDLIWSEGAIDNIGFAAGLAHWRGFLKPGGFVAASCPSWLTEKRPAEVERFWTEAGSGLDSVQQNVAALQACGFRFVGAFALPEACWTENYFAPREQAIRRLVEKYDACDTALQYAALNRREVELYRAHQGDYGYVFYVGQAV